MILWLLTGFLHKVKENCAFIIDLVCGSGLEWKGELPVFSELLYRCPENFELNRIFLQSFPLDQSLEERHVGEDAKEVECLWIEVLILLEEHLGVEEVARVVDK